MSTLEQEIRRIVREEIRHEALRAQGIAPTEEEAKAWTNVTTPPISFNPICPTCGKTVWQLEEYVFGGAGEKYHARCAYPAVVVEQRS